MAQLSQRWCGAGSGSTDPSARPVSEAGRPAKQFSSLLWKRVLEEILLVPWLHSPPSSTTSLLCSHWHINSLSVCRYTSAHTTSISSQQSFVLACCHLSISLYYFVHTSKSVLSLSVSFLVCVCVCVSLSWMCCLYDCIKMGLLSVLLRRAWVSEMWAVKWSVKFGGFDCLKTRSCDLITGAELKLQEEKT